MTYQTLQSEAMPVTLASEYISQGSDEAEARHWQSVIGAPVDDEIDYTGDLTDMGLR